MKKNIEEIIKEYENNINNARKYNSYINEVREYKGYIFKEINDLKKFKNESQWLKEFMNLNYCTPKIIGTYNQKIIIMEKIKGITIKDGEAKEHLYNIGKLMANLHNIPIKQKVNWKKAMMSEYLELKESAKGLMENNIFEISTGFLEQKLEKINVSKLAVIHRDLRPENIIYSEGKYYLLDLESMCIGDRDYDFTRMLNLLNQKEIYQYEDFKNLIDGYRYINDIEISEGKWQLYNRFYAFRIYSKMLTGKIDRDSEFEGYLKNILIMKYDRVTEWIKKYNLERKI